MQQPINGLFENQFARVDAVEPACEIAKPAERRKNLRESVKTDDDHALVEGHRIRLRDRVSSTGHENLADYEILEMLLFAVNRRCDTKTTAKLLLRRFGSLLGIFAADDRALEEVEGVGKRTITLLRAVHAVSVRLRRDDISGSTALPNMSSWGDVAGYCRIAFGADPKEQFRVFFLDTRNQLLKDEVLGRGTVNHTPVYPREVIARALALNASALILVHNHPSGDVTPSDADVAMTRLLVQAALPFDIAIHDHIIVGRSASFSFRARGLLGKPKPSAAQPNPLRKSPARITNPSSGEKNPR